MVFLGVFSKIIILIELTFPPREKIFNLRDTASRISPARGTKKEG
jgi:hypothetical protein